jgi:DNA helicase II / ATP-dependent DNA helicase PcrA
LRRVLEETRYVDWLRDSSDGDWEDRHANVLELLAGAARFTAEVPEESLIQWLDSVALYTNLDSSAAGEERVVLMTVHNAKGLEFPQVFITGLEEGLFPHVSSFADPEEMEEERRLFYVAATRAMRKLHLSASLERRRVNRLEGGSVSRFVREIPSGMLQVELEEVRGFGLSSFGGYARRGDFGSGASRRPSSPGFASREHERNGERTPVGRAESDEPTIRYAGRESEPDWKGREVRHAIFGVGRVLSQEGVGSDARLNIQFPQVGRKKVVARFVRGLEA